MTISNDYAIEVLFFIAYVITVFIGIRKVFVWFKKKVSKQSTKKGVDHGRKFNERK